MATCCEIGVMAGPSTEISFLLDYNSSRRSLRANSLNHMPSVIVKSLKETFDKEFTLKYITSTQSFSEEPVAIHGDFIIRRWSSQYNCFVDVVSLIEIESGDKLTVAPCPSVEVGTCTVLVMHLSMQSPTTPLPGQGGAL